MTQYDNTNRGVLFKNHRKQTDRHPDYTGSVNVDGVEFFLDAWLKDGPKGKFMSLSVKRKDKQPEPVKQAGGYGAEKGGSRTATPVQLDDEIPF